MISCFAARLKCKSSFLFRISFAVSLLLFVAVVTVVKCNCQAKRRNDEVMATKSFKNLTGAYLEAAVIDEMSQQNKTNPRIKLRNFEISKITKSMLSKFPHIYSIDLRSNSIAEIESGSFGECSKLEKIDLMENRLTKIMKNIFSGDFNELQEINLSFNGIAGIESGSFDHLNALESIDLSHNCLKHLHSDLFKRCPDLRQVSINENEIAKIESDLFSSKSDLKHLDMSANRLDFIPELELKRIRHYDLSHNYIALLDLNYDSLERKKSASVEELILAFNQISDCRELEERRTDIVHLDLHENMLLHLNDFPGFMSLEMLILSNNNLSDLSLHDFEEKFPSLKVLNISGNANVDCDDYRYVTENLQKLVVSADKAVINRCHHSIREAATRELDEYEEPIIYEIRSRADAIVSELQFNRGMLIIMLSAFVLLVIIASISLLHFQLQLTRKRREPNLIEQIEL